MGRTYSYGFSEHKRLTHKPLIDNLMPVNREDTLSSKIKVGALDDFKLFYEELVNTKPLQGRLKRARKLPASAN